MSSDGSDPFLTPGMPGVQGPDNFQVDGSTPFDGGSLPGVKTPGAALEDLRQELLQNNEEFQASLVAFIAILRAQPQQQQQQQQQRNNEVVQQGVIEQAQGQQRRVSPELLRRLSGQQFLVPGGNVEQQLVQELSALLGNAGRGPEIQAALTLYVNDVARFLESEQIEVQQGIPTGDPAQRDEHAVETIDDFLMVHMDPVFEQQQVAGAARHRMRQALAEYLLEAREALVYQRVPQGAPVPGDEASRGQDVQMPPNQGRAQEQGLYPIPEIADIIARLQPNQFVTMPETDAMARHLFPFAQQQGYTMNLGELKTAMHWIAHQYEGYNGELDRTALERMVSTQFAQYQNPGQPGGDQFQSLVVDLIVRINAAQRGLEAPPAPVLPEGFTVDQTSARLADLDAVRERLEQLGIEIANARYDDNHDEVSRLNEEYNALLYDNDAMIPEEEYENLQRIFMEAEEAENVRIPQRLEEQRVALEERLLDEAEAYARDVAEGRVARDADHEAALQQRIQRALSEEVFHEAAQRIEDVSTLLFTHMDTGYELELNRLDAETQAALEALIRHLTVVAEQDASHQFQRGETDFSSDSLTDDAITSFDRIALLRARVPDLGTRIQEAAFTAFQARQQSLEERDQELQTRIPAELLELARREGELLALLEAGTIPGTPDRSMAEVLGGNARELLEDELQTLRVRRDQLLSPGEGGPYEGNEAVARQELLLFYQRHPEYLADGDLSVHDLYSREKERSLTATQHMGVVEGTSVPGYEVLADQLANLLQGDPPPTEAQLLSMLYRLRMSPDIRSLVAGVYEDRMGEPLNTAITRILQSEQGQSTWAAMRAGTYDDAVFRSVLQGYASIPDEAARRLEVLRMLSEMSPDYLAVLDRELQEGEPATRLAVLVCEVAGEDMAAWLVAYRAEDLSVRRAIEIRLLLASNPPNEASVLMIFQAAGIEGARDIATAFQIRYSQALSEYVSENGPGNIPRVSALSRPYIAAVLSGNQERVDTEGLVLALGFRSPRETGGVQLQDLFDHLQSLPEARRAEAIANVQRFIETYREHFLGGIPMSETERSLLDGLNGGALRDYLYLQSGRDSNRTAQILHILGIEGEEPATQEDIDRFQQQSLQSQQHLAQVLQLVQHYEGDELLLRLFQMNLTEEQFRALIAQFRAMNNEDLLPALRLAIGEQNQRALELLLRGNRVSFVRSELMRLLRHLSENPYHSHQIMRPIQQIASFVRADNYVGVGRMPIDRGFTLIAGLNREELTELSRSVDLDGTLDVIGGQQLLTMARARQDGNGATAHASYLAYLISAPASSNNRGQRIIDFLRSIPADERAGVLRSCASLLGSPASVTALFEQAPWYSSVSPEQLPLIRAYLEGDEASVQRVELFSVAGLYGGQPDFISLNAMMQSVAPADRMRLYRQMEAYAASNIESILENLEPPLTETQRAAMNAIDRGPLGQLMFVRNGRNAYHAMQTLRLFGARAGEGPLSNQELQQYSARMAAASRFIQGMEQGLNQEGAMRLQGDGVTSTLIIINMDSETLAVAESMYCAQRGTSFRQHLRDAVPDAGQRGALDAYFSGGRVAAVSQRIQSMIAAGENVENANLIRSWLERLTPAEVEQVAASLNARQEAIVLNDALASIGGEDLRRWIQAHRAGDLALRDAVQLHMILSPTTVSTDAFGQFVQSVGNNRFRAALTRYQQQYNQTPDEIANRMPVRHRELARAYMTGNQQLIDREIVYIGLGLRGGVTSAEELQRMNLVLARMNVDTRTALLQQARNYAAEHYRDIVPSNYRSRMSNPTSAMQALNNIILASTTADPALLANADRAQLLRAHRDRVISLFTQPISNQDMAQYLALQQVIMQRQAQYSTVQQELLSAQNTNRDRANGQWRMVRDTNREIDDWNLSASIPVWSWASGSGNLYDALVAQRRMQRNHARQYDTLVRNLGVARTRASGIIGDAQEAELRALQLTFQGQHQQAQLQLATSNQQLTSLTRLLESDIARTSPNYSAMMNDLRQNSARFQSVIDGCNTRIQVIGYVRTGVAIVGGGAVMLVTGGAAAPVVAALYVTAAMAPGELVQAGLEIHNGADPGNALLRAGGRSGMNFLNAWGGASGVRALSTVTRTTGQTLITNSAGRVVSSPTVMRQFTLNFLGRNFAGRQVITNAGRQLMNQSFNQGARSVVRSEVLRRGFTAGAPILITIPANVWSHSNNAPTSNRPLHEPQAQRDNNVQPRPGISISGEPLELEGVPRTPTERAEPQRLQTEFRVFEGNVDVSIAALPQTPPPRDPPPVVEPVPVQTGVPPATIEPPIDQREPQLPRPEPGTPLPTDPVTTSQGDPDLGVPIDQQASNSSTPPTGRNNSGRRPGDGSAPGDGTGGDGKPGGGGGVDGGGVVASPGDGSGGDPPVDPAGSSGSAPGTGNAGPRRARKPRGGSAAQDDPPVIINPGQAGPAAVTPGDGGNGGSGGRDEDQDDGPPEYHGPTIEMMDEQRRRQMTELTAEAAPQEDLQEVSLGLGRDNFLGTLHDNESLHQGDERQDFLQMAQWERQKQGAKTASTNFVDAMDAHQQVLSRKESARQSDSVQQTHQSLMQFAQTSTQSQGMSQSQSQTQSTIQSQAQSVSQEKVKTVIASEPQSSSTSEKIETPVSQGQHSGQKQTQAQGSKRQSAKSETTITMSMNRVSKERARQQAGAKKQGETASEQQSKAHGTAEISTKKNSESSSFTQSSSQRQADRSASLQGKSETLGERTSRYTRKEESSGFDNKQETVHAEERKESSQNPNQGLMHNTGDVRSASDSMGSVRGEVSANKAEGRIHEKTASSESTVDVDQTKTGSKSITETSGSIERKQGSSTGEERTLSTNYVFKEEKRAVESERLKQEEREVSTIQKTEKRNGLSEKIEEKTTSTGHEVSTSESIVIAADGSRVRKRSVAEAQGLNASETRKTQVTEERTSERTFSTTKEEGTRQASDRYSSRKQTHLRHEKVSELQTLRRLYNEIERVQTALGLRAPDLAQTLFTTWAAEQGVPSRDIARVVRDSRRRSLPSASKVASERGARKGLSGSTQRDDSSWGSFLDVLDEILVTTESEQGVNSKGDFKGDERGNSEKRIVHKGKPRGLSRRLKRRGKNARKKIRKRKQLREEQLTELLMMQIIMLLRSKEKRKNLDYALMLKLLGQFNPELANTLKETEVLDVEADVQAETAMVALHNPEEKQDEEDRTHDTISRAELLRKLRATTAVSERLETQSVREQEIYAVTRADVLRSMQRQDDGPKIRESRREKEGARNLRDRLNELRDSDERKAPLPEPKKDNQNKSRADHLRRLKEQKKERPGSEKKPAKTTRADLLKALKDS